MSSQTRRERVQDRGDRDDERHQHRRQRAEDEEEDHERAQAADQRLGQDARARLPPAERGVLERIAPGQVDRAHRVAAWLPSSSACDLVKCTDELKFGFSGGIDLREGRVPVAPRRRRLLPVDK